MIYCDAAWFVPEDSDSRVRGPVTIAIGPHDIRQPKWYHSVVPSIGLGQANGGKFTVLNKETEFVTRWSSCGADAVYAYKDNVEMVGYKAGQRQIPYSKDDFETFDWSHRSVIAHVGDVIVFMNHAGRFLAAKVMKVSDHERGAAADSLHIEFRIY